jgi:radical SAM protein with 4Fe4S-binding SPASM domain
MNHPPHTHSAATPTVLGPNRYRRRPAPADWSPGRPPGQLQPGLQALPGRGHLQTLTEGELDTAAAFRLLDQIAEVGQPDRHPDGRGTPAAGRHLRHRPLRPPTRGLRMVMAPNGTLVTPVTRPKKWPTSGIQRISISLDGATRGKPRQPSGASRAPTRGPCSGIEIRQGGRPRVSDQHHHLQDSTWTRFRAILELAVNLWEPWPTISSCWCPPAAASTSSTRRSTAQEYEETLNWFYDQRDKTSLQLKATCAPALLPHPAPAGPGRRPVGDLRIPRPWMPSPGAAWAAPASAFISHRGMWCSPADFLEVDCGNVTRHALRGDLAGIQGTLLAAAELSANYKDKCGACEYKRVCGGCRARAFEATGDFMAAGASVPV